MIKMLDLLTEDEIFQECGSTNAGLQAVLILNGASYIGSEVGIGVVEVKLGQKGFGLGGSIGIVTLSVVMRVRNAANWDFASQYRACSRSSGNEASQGTEGV